MTRSTKPSAVTLLALLAVLPIGCKSSDSSTPYRGNAVESGDLKLDAMPNTLVEIFQPTVDVADKTTTIAGSVRRKPGVSQALAGRIDIEFVDTDGQVLDSLPALLTPQKIPQDSATPCTFHTAYDYLPPKGSTVRLHFVDSDTAAREDLAGNTIESGRVTGGNFGGIGSHSGTASHYGNNGGGGRGW